MTTATLECSGCGTMHPLTEMDLGEDWAACSDECLDKLSAEWEKEGDTA